MATNIKIKTIYFIFFSLFGSLQGFDVEEFRLFISNPSNTEVGLNQSCEKYNKLFEILYQIITNSEQERRTYKYLISPLANPQHTTFIPAGTANSILELDDEHLLITTTENIEIFNHKNGQYFSHLADYHKNKQTKCHKFNNVYFALHGVIKCWNHERGELYEPLAENSNNYVHKVIPLQNDVIIALCWQEVINVWDCKQEKLLHQFRGHTEWINAAVQLHSGYFASASDDGFIKIWNPNTQKCITTLEGHKDWVRSIIQLKNTNLASASDDDTIKIWDFATKLCQKTLYGHTGEITAIIQLCNGDLASASYDQTIKIWNSSTGCCLQTIYGHSNWITQLIQLSNGDIASLSEDNVIKIWHIYPDEIKELFTRQTKKIIKRIILLLQLQHARKKNRHLLLPTSWLKIFDSLPAPYQEMYERYIQREQCFIS